MPAPTKIHELVEHFERNIEAYCSVHYNETQVRREFIDPLFKCLGWDVDNEAGFAEAYKDVRHEDVVQIEGAAKVPDYSFRIGGQRKFFLEAKKPAVQLKSDPAPAYQLRRYGWNGKLALSIVTSFAELAVYDCRVKPFQSDKPAVARIMYLTYKEYIEKWDEIAGIFSKEAVQKGSFDKYAETNKTKRGTTTVDEAFLEEIEGWRDLLAKNIALRNLTITERELKFAVQAIIDRIVFLRMCEDRGIETYGQLRKLLEDDDVYKGLMKLCNKADDRYNSGLFYFHAEKDRPEPPDALTPKLIIDDKPLKEILRHLYYPESPYEFSMISGEILGQVYEQFLGKVIRLTGAHHAKIEDKPEVKKAGGVYYTPAYIVDYIVHQTVDKLLDGKKGEGEAPAEPVVAPSRPRGSAGASPSRGLTPKQASKLRVLDPACGSGSFLLGAYQRLLDWHLEQYVKDTPEKRTKEVFQGAGGGAWRLTTAEKKRILLNNIYGVDIDPQAVEVTKLSLLLKVLEGENEQTLATQLKLFHERALPDLGSNIKCGNSLIGPDFYNGQQMMLFDEEERYRINVFDWKEAFPQVMKAGGFDAVIGNPPYIRIQALQEWAPQEAEHYRRQYQSAAKGNYDIYVVFVERGLQLLNGHGSLGFILPHKFFNAQYGLPLRELLSRGQHLSSVVHFGHQQVFPGAATYTCLLFLDKAGSSSCWFIKIDDLEDWRGSGRVRDRDIPAKAITAAEWNFAVGDGLRVFAKLQKMPIKLRDVADRMGQGIRTSANEVYVLDAISVGKRLVSAYSKQLDRQIKLERELLVPFLLGRDIKPYQLRTSEKLALITYRMEGDRAELLSLAELQRDYPLTFDYLQQNKKHLENREQGRMRGPTWHAFIYPKNLALMRAPKILVPDIADRAAFALDEKGEYAFTSGYGITLKSTVAESPKYVLGLLNSTLLDFFLKRVSTTLRGGFFRYFTQFIEQLPIRSIDFADAADKARHDRMVRQVEQMLALHKQLSSAKAPHDKTALQNQIAATDRQIDQLVYELYGLADDEIRIVEEATAGKG